MRSMVLQSRRAVRRIGVRSAAMFFAVTAMALPAAAAGSIAPTVAVRAPETVAANAAGVVVLAQISGVVATRDGQPLPGALVSVYGAETPVEARFAVTDDEGRFEVDEATPGMYSLRAFLAGFFPSPPQQVLVSQSASLADSLRLEMAAVSAETAAGTLSELRWLLRRGRRNVLKERDPEVALAGGASRFAPGAPSFPSAPFAFEGEFSVFAAAGSSLGLSEGQALDSGIAYTRFAMPATARGKWEAEARLMESAFASWATNVAYEMEPLDGHQFSAGLGYQRHVYRDAASYRPEAAPMLNIALLQEPEAEWDAAAFVADEIDLGAASLSTGLTYRRFSYLSGQRGLAPRAVLRIDATDRWALVGGLAVRVDGPVGEDSSLLSRVAHGDLLVFDPAAFRNAPAQRSSRYQAGVQYQASPDAVFAARVFREDTSNQIFRSFETGPREPGRFEVTTGGDFSAHGLAVDFVREMAPLTRRLEVGGRVSWLVARVRQPMAASETALGATSPNPNAPDDFSAIAALVPELAPELTGDPTVFDVSAEVAARLQPSGTTLNAACRIIGHSGLALARTGGERTTRFDVEVVQLIPFADWSGTEWELSFAVRDLFFRDMLGRSLLDELAVARAPRRVVGGLAVRF